MKKLLSGSRYVVIIAVAGSFLAGAAMLLSGGITLMKLLAETLLYGTIGGKQAKLLALGLIESVDLFLLGTVFYITSLGLYELFIDDTIELPGWLAIHTLDDLKNKLAGVIVVIMAVIFLGHVVNWHGEPEIIYLGASIALVVSALTWFLGPKRKA